MDRTLKAISLLLSYAQDALIQIGFDRIGKESQGRAGNGASPRWEAQKTRDRTPERQAR